MQTPRGWVALLVVSAFTLLAACAEGSPSSSTSSSPPLTSPTASVVPVDQFCGPETPTAGVTLRQVPVGDATRLNVAELGTGPTVAVLLHQIDGNGLCGFLFYAQYLAKRGVKVTAMDLCGYGQSDCRDTAIYNDPASQVEAVADAAREAGATRVVLVGASMGGTTAVHAARAAGADAIVDLSGPAEFNEMTIAADASGVTMPALFAYAATDQSDLDAVHGQLAGMPSTQKTFLTYRSGHGYDLLHRADSMTAFTPLAGRVLSMVRSGK